MGKIEDIYLRTPGLDRISYVSDRAKAIWSYRMNRIQWALYEMAFLAVSRKIQKGIVTTITPGHMVERSTRLAGMGLVVLPIDRIYTGDGNSFLYLTAVFQADYGRPLLLQNNTVELSELHYRLGWPSCCESLAQQKIPDAEILKMALNTAGRAAKEGRCELTAAFECNTVLRTLGLTAVFHNPCSFNCEATINIGKQIFELGCSSGYAIEFEWLEQILSWPMEWDSYHGIANIRTPIFRMVVPANPGKERSVVRLLGGQIPDESVHGLNFPYNLAGQIKTGNDAKGS